MELHGRNQAVSELRSSNNKLTIVIVLLVVCLTLLSAKLFNQSEIIINQTPGMPSDSRIERSAMDKRAQEATLSTVTAALAQLNPSNIEYQKELIQVFLAPKLYTRVSAEMMKRVEDLVIQRELGSYYFTQKGYEYDEKLNKHFVWGAVHTVNAAKDTSKNFVFEYNIHIENYRLVVDEISIYESDVPHNSAWMKASIK